MATNLIEKVIKPVARNVMSLEGSRLLSTQVGDSSLGDLREVAGLTGRKIVVDTYGGFSRHGGGAFSGRNPSKVDRSAAYAMRWVAKNIVASGVAKKAEVHVSFAVGVSETMYLMVETFGTGIISDSEITAMKEVFDLRLWAIIRDLELLKPRYLKTATYGHFCREDPGFPWEEDNRAELIAQKPGITQL